MKLYACWRCVKPKTPEEYKEGRKENDHWFPLKDLIKANEDNTHVDYKCPRCETVVICETKIKR